MHVHEYATHWLVHRDHGDPRTFEGAISHLIYDAPEIPLSIAVAGISGTVVGKIIYELRKDDSNDAVTEAITAGGIASVFSGLLTFLLLRRE